MLKQSPSTRFMNTLAVIAFGLQIGLQSVPYDNTLHTDDVDLCTCGCGHTSEICAASHADLLSGSFSCGCQHQHSGGKQLSFPSKQIREILLTAGSVFPFTKTATRFSPAGNSSLTAYRQFDIFHPPQT
jgi:hypothetical protein